MAVIAYDNYIYRLSTTAPQTVYSVNLPKDLYWEDELTWNKVDMNAEYALTGNLLIEEGVKLKGRYISLLGLDNMAWITREQGLTLMAMRDTPGLVALLSFVDKNNSSNVLFSHHVMFRNNETALDLKTIKQWDQYEAGAYYIVNGINLMETLPYGS